MADSMETQTIFQCLDSLKDCSEQRQSLYHHWQTKLSENKINVETRSKNEEWFQKCFQYCKRERSTFGPDMVTIDMVLYQDLVNQLAAQAQAEDDPMVLWKLQDQLADLQEHKTPGEWIERAYRCVVEERTLVEIYTKSCMENIPMKESCEHLYHKLAQKKRAAGEKLNQLEAEVQNLRRDKEQWQRFVSDNQRLQEITNSLNGFQNGMNGLQKLAQQGNLVEENARENMTQSIQKFYEIFEEIKPDFEALYEAFQKMIGRLAEEQECWQHQLKLKYAELYADVNLHDFAPWCAKTGDLLRDAICTDIPRLENAVKDVMGSDNQSCEPLYAQFNSLLIPFYQRTFVVSEQNDWNVKKSVTRPLTVSLRMLASDSYAAIGGVEVHAAFVLESQFNSCYNQGTGQLDIMKLKEKSFKFKNGQSTKFVKHSNIAEAKFSNIELCINLTRSKAVPVFEEKYRLVFFTQLGNEIYWTMSMPMVVTTGASQQCQCLASVMWQCFSTDVFAVPIKPSSSLSWSDVAKMLQAKMKNLPSHRSLTEENIQHLKQRLLGTSEAADTTDISLHQFCNRPLESSTEKRKANFTFWEWFLSIYNFLRLPNVVEFWKKGNSLTECQTVKILIRWLIQKPSDQDLHCLQRWIDGFLSKAEAEKKLTECQQGVFLLRFSDWHIRPSQGKDAVYGMVSPTVHWTNNGMREVCHVDPIGYDLIQKLPLANILLDIRDRNANRICKYLYNFFTSSEELFMPYTSLGPQIPGYTGLRNAFIANLEKLEQDLIKLELGGKRPLTSCSKSENEFHDDGYGSILKAILEPKKLKFNCSPHVSPATENQDTDSGVIPCNQIATTQSEVNVPALQTGSQIPVLSKVSSHLEKELSETVPLTGNNEETYQLPTSTFNPSDISQTSSCTSKRAVSSNTSVNLCSHFNAETQGDIYFHPIDIQLNLNHSSPSHLVQLEVQKHPCGHENALGKTVNSLNSPSINAGCQLQKINFTECVNTVLPRGYQALNPNSETIQSVSNPVHQSNTTENSNLSRERETYCQTTEDETVYGLAPAGKNVSDKGKAKNDVADSEVHAEEMGAIEMIKSYLSNMPAEMILAAIPQDKMQEVMTQCLGELPAEWSMKVLEELQNRMSCNQYIQKEPTKNCIAGEQKYQTEEVGISVAEEKTNPAISAGKSLMRDQQSDKADFAGFQSDHMTLVGKSMMTGSQSSQAESAGKGLAECQPFQAGSAGKLLTGYQSNQAESAAQDITGCLSSQAESAGKGLTECQPSLAGSAGKRLTGYQAESAGKGLTEYRSFQAGSAGKCLTGYQSNQAESAAQDITGCLSSQTESAGKGLTECQPFLAGSAGKCLTGYQSNQAESTGKGLTEYRSFQAGSAGKCLTGCRSNQTESTEKLVTGCQTEASEENYVLADLHGVHLHSSEIEAGLARAERGMGSLTETIEDYWDFDLEKLE